VALTDELVVAQNTFPETRDSLEGRFELPFERFGREDLILAINGFVGDSETIDPITLEERPVSGYTERSLWIEMRRDPGTGRLSWGASIGRSESGLDYGVRSIESEETSNEWSAFVEWEVIDDLRLRFNVNGDWWRDDTETFYDTVRQPGLTPSFLATEREEADRQPSFTVDWRRRENFEIRASISTQPEVRNLETLYPWGSPTGTSQAVTYAESPQMTVRFRYFR
jgi:outer membrane receptor protein involved in Fe transport